MLQLPDNLQDLMRMVERLGDDAMDKKESGSGARPAKVGKDNNSWQERKKRKKNKHVYEKLEPKPNNKPKGGKPKGMEGPFQLMDPGMSCPDLVLDPVLIELVGDENHLEARAGLSRPSL